MNFGIPMAKALRIINFSIILYSLILLLKPFRVINYNMSYQRSSSSRINFQKRNNSFMTRPRERICPNIIHFDQENLNFFFLEEWIIFVNFWEVGTLTVSFSFLVEKMMGGRGAEVEGGREEGRVQNSTIQSGQ